jgi:hypothetical protein
MFVKNHHYKIFCTALILYSFATFLLNCHPFGKPSGVTSKDFKSDSTALVQQLKKFREELGLEDALKKLAKYELLILDDIGYVKKSDSEIQVVFELIAHRYKPGRLLGTLGKHFLLNQY